MTAPYSNGTGPGNFSLQPPVPLSRNIGFVTEDSQQNYSYGGYGYAAPQPPHHEQYQASVPYYPPQTSYPQHSAPYHTQGGSENSAAYNPYFQQSSNTPGVPVAYAGEIRPVEAAVGYEGNTSEYDVYGKKKKFKKNKLVKYGVPIAGVALGAYALKKIF